MHARFLLSVPLLALVASRLPAQQRISKLGQYEGYSARAYDGYVRSSQYLTMRDGVRLAIDIVRPARGGVVETRPLPVLWTHSRYQRATIHGDTLRSVGDGDMKEVLLHGYVLASVDTRGGGASFGTQQGFFMRTETRDAWEITEWLARQPWSTGKIGMFGASYGGITQYFAASERPPHLTAIFPMFAFFDVYTLIYPGGIYRDDFFANWQKLTYHLDRSIPIKWYDLPAIGLGRVAPVDGDSGAILLDSAIKGHDRNRPMDEMWSGVPHRNSVDPGTGQPIHRERSPSTYLGLINRSGVAVYTLGGWYDAFPRDAVTWFRNLKLPEKLVLGPWYHTERHTLDFAKEQLRWFDFWLKGIDNGIMREPKISYWLLNAPPGTEWRTANAWPLPTERRTRFYFHQGPSGSVGSPNDGSLDRALISGNGRDQYPVDYTTSPGKANRWANTYGGRKPYGDLRENDAKALTFTTAPLGEDLEVTGHPVVSLWISSTAKDGDFFLYLEDVDDGGKSSYVTEGALRASHRRLSPAPYDNLGLPWHRSHREDAVPLAAGPVELRFDLQPTSILFRKGHRIRVAITGADAANHTPPQAPPPFVTLWRDRRHPSHIELPVIPDSGSHPSVRRR